MDVISQTDFDELYEQKLALHEVICDQPDAEDVVYLIGLVNFLDAVFDAVKQDGLWIPSEESEEELD
jgi:hypothetical protein